MCDKLPLISIIIPVYKVAEYLNECVESVTSQSYKNLEIILVDDGSPDECPAMCDVWAERDNRIKVIHKENGGASSARNAGLDAAKGEYIGFVDSDDFIDRNMYSCLFDALQKTGKKMSCCRSLTFKDSDAVSDISVSDPLNTEIFSACEAIDKIFSFKLGTSFWRRLFHRSLFDGLRLPEGEINEEYPLLLPLTVRAGGTVFVDKILYYYRDRSDSVTGTLHKSIVTLRCVRNNIEIINKQISEYGLTELKYFSFFVAKNSYFMLLSIIKNHNKINDELEALYKSYILLAKGNKAAFLKSDSVNFKDKLIFRLILSGIYRKVYMLKRK